MKIYLDTLRVVQVVFTIQVADLVDMKLHFRLENVQASNVLAKLCSCAQQ